MTAAELYRDEFTPAPSTRAMRSMLDEVLAAERAR